MRLRCTSILYLVLSLVASWQILAHDTDDCDSNNDCLNGGICVPDDIHSNDSSHEHMVCQCIGDFIGSYCTERCLITCQNGGICQKRSTNDNGDGSTYSSDFICICPSTFDGPLCDTNIVNGDASSSSVSKGKTFGIVFGTILVIAIVLMYVTYLRRRRKQMDDPLPKNDIEGANATALDDKTTNNLSLSSNDVTKDRGAVI